LLAAEMADAHEGFRLRIAEVFVRWAGQIQSLLWEACPQLQDDVDAVRLSRFIIAALEGGLMMSRVKRDIVVMEGVAYDLQRFISSQLREPVREPVREPAPAASKSGALANASDQWQASARRSRRCRQHDWI